MKLFRTYARSIVLIVVFSIISQLCFPVVAYALTSGPSQPEASVFKQASVSDMVDLFTGNFSYNIPLLDVDGYPINISYAAGPGMDQEASWVGLGWSLNPGSISRDMRGLPDDFKGDSITKVSNIKPNVTTGVNLGAGCELAGIKLGLSASGGIYYNTYRGYGLQTSFSPTFSIGNCNSTELSVGLGLHFDSQQGIDLTPAIGLCHESDRATRRVGLSTDISSRTGMKGLTISYHSNHMFLANLTGIDGIDGMVSFASPTYVPTSPLPMTNNSFTFHGAIGGELFILNGNAFIDGYQSTQKLAFNTQKQRAIGSLNSSVATRIDLMDFNRERQSLPWKDYMTVFPPGFGTSDLYLVQGQGLGTQFRVARNDIGHFNDAAHFNGSNSASLGIKAGAIPNLGKIGVDVNLANVNSATTDWNTNPAGKITRFTKRSNRTLYEPVYFKSSDEMVAMDETYFSKLGNSNPMAAQFEAHGTTRPLYWNTSNQKIAGSTGFTTTDSLTRQTRDGRNTVFQYLNATEASQFALEKNITTYQKNKIRLSSANPTCAIDASVARTSWPSHHISEVTITKPDGGRYVYGIPAYNTRHKEVSFSVTNQTETGSGLISYDATDNTVSNTKGRDNFLSSEEIPPYAYAYLLTAVLSHDYIDRTGNGITPDDNGHATRINYYKNSKTYRWRTPCSATTQVARYQPGKKSDSKDDKASYVYGEKEIYYVHSIESTTTVAQFYTSSRKDAYCVAGENGGLVPSNDTLGRMLQKLDSIALFSKSDLQKNGANAKPIKTVHFNYDYLLCPNTPNSIAPNGCKLTLTGIYFTYGKSQRGKLNAYTFSYKIGPAAIGALPFSYNLTNIDRWGNYKVQPSSYPLITDFPFSLQDTTTLNGAAGGNLHEYAAAWSLTTIGLPSGGYISVSYESDDYAYVQDKRAGEMFFVRGFNQGAPDSTTFSNALYTSGGASINNYLWVDLRAFPMRPGTVTDTAQFRARCLADMKYLHYDAEVNMTSGANPERIQGYCQIDYSSNLKTVGVDGGGNLIYVGIPLKLAAKENGGVINPITKVALQTLRLELPELAFPGYVANNISFTALVKGMASLVQSTKELINGFESVGLSQNKAASATIGRKSWIRLSNPTFKKYGGGYRVKSIQMTDNWNSMTGKPNATYGQNYYYTTTEQVKIGNTVQTLTISSGVASWEPPVGGGELLLKEPVSLTEKVVLGPDNSYYVEKPFCESLFPSPVVGYSEVRVQSINNATNPRTGIGWTIHKFNTARDFPTIVDYTPISFSTNKGRQLTRFLNLFVKDHLAVTQGYSVEVNDMHGKKKEETEYAQNGKVIASTIYHYKVDNDFAVNKHLNNQVKIASGPSATYANNKLLGVDFDVWQDARQETTVTKGIGFSSSADGFVAFLLPLIIPTLFPGLHGQDIAFNSFVTTKYIKRQGVLDKVTVLKDGSTISTENLLFDPQTGAVIVSKTQNEFEDAMYQINLPAYWAYDGLGQAYQNADATFSKMYVSRGIPYVNNNFSTTSNILPNYQSMFSEGDLIMATKEGVTPTTMVQLIAYKVGSDTMRLFDNNGVRYQDNLNSYTLKVKRSGRRNMPTMPVGTLVSRVDPTATPYSSLSGFLAASNTNIVNATASTKSEIWQADCSCGAGAPNQVVNPYLVGMRGIWRGDKNYVYHQQRTSNSQGSATYVRSDGVVASFNSFWQQSGSGPFTANPNATGWIQQSAATITDVKGNQNEERDALGIYSAAHFGYLDNFNTAVVHNSKYSQSMFEGFEDYNFKISPNCESPTLCDTTGKKFDDNGQFRPSAINNSHLLQGTGHTGRNAYYVGGNDSITLRCNLYIPTDTVVLGITTDGKSYKIGSSGCHPGLQLSAGDYLVSCWVNVNPNGNCATTVSGAQVQIKFNNPSPPTPIVLSPSGPIIEGWQRIYGKITIPSATINYPIEIKMFCNNTGEAAVYFDDFRIHPWLANMKASVYDPITLRLAATLDENNYATFYEYDDEGGLIRVKKETERGIMTIEEHRSSLKN
jgi:hypothetical protein